MQLGGACGSGVYIGGRGLVPEKVFFTSFIALYLLERYEIFEYRVKFILQPCVWSLYPHFFVVALSCMQLFVYEGCTSMFRTEDF